jgi:hypothetical protein
MFAPVPKGGFLSRRIWIIVLLAVVAGALAVVLSVLAATGPATIRITDVQTADTLVDRGDRGIQAGDLEIIRQLLYNRRVSSSPIGRSYILCTMLTKSMRMCTATYTLPKGTLVTSVTTGTRLLYEAAITGGTELYNNARGALVVTTTALKPRREVLVFRLAG